MKRSASHHRICSWLPFTLAILLTLLGVGCAADAASEGLPQPSPPSEIGQASEDESPLAEAPELIARVLQPSFGDWDELVERRVIRVLVTYNKTNFFIDGGRQRGITADALHEWEKALNEELRLGARPMNVAAIPVPRDKLIDYLVEGRGDLAAASLTITPERASRVDFTRPGATKVAEIAVTGPGGLSLGSVDDLAGKEVHVRRSSSYFESLQTLNRSFRERGLQEIQVVEASEYLETEDLLEMTQAGLIPITVADDYLARFWKQVFTDLVLHEGSPVATGREIAWAVRPGAPALKARADAFVGANRRGTLLGNILFKRYFENTRWIDNPTADAERERYQQYVELFRKYGKVYNFDYLALGVGYAF